MQLLAGTYYVYPNQVHVSSPYARWCGVTPHRESDVHISYGDNFELKAEQRNEQAAKRLGRKKIGSNTSQTSTRTQQPDTADSIPTKMDTVAAPSAIFKPGNTAVITGGASGIGLALAKKCAGYGMKVLAADWNAELLAAIPADVATTYQMDVSKAADWAGFKEKIQKDFDGTFSISTGSHDLDLCV